MIFKCRCCNETVDEIPKLTAGMSELVFEPEWLAKGEDIPPLDEHIWLRSDEFPQAGERRLIKVSAPFKADIGERLNLLYLPANAALNDWDGAPEELELSAVVYGIFERVLSNDNYCAWIEVNIERVVPFPELCKHYPCRKISSLFEGGFGECTKLDFRWRNWEYYVFSAQGDCGEWRLIFTDDEGKRHLVMFYEYGWHDGFAQVGNAVVDS